MMLYKVLLLQGNILEKKSNNMEYLRYPPKMNDRPTARPGTAFSYDCLFVTVFVVALLRCCCGVVVAVFVG